MGKGCPKESGSARALGLGWDWASSWVGLMEFELALVWALLWAIPRDNLTGFRMVRAWACGLGAAREESSEEE